MNDVRIRELEQVLMVGGPTHEVLRAARELLEEVKLLSRPSSLRERTGEGKSVRVRVAVAVNDTGHWNACGCWQWEGDRQHEAVDVASMGLDETADNEAVHWIEADVPVPVSSVVEGRLVAGEGKEE